MTARMQAAAGIIALLLLQAFWHGVATPPKTGSAWLYVAFLCVPLLPSLALFALRHRAAPLVGAIAALLYFCDGVMVAMNEPTQRAFALAEVALSVLVVAAASWNGVRARFARKPAV